MPIISTLGRQQPRVQALIWSIYAILTLGAATMVYPFLLMISSSTKSGVDTVDSVIIPSYLISQPALYRKHIEGLYNESSLAMQMAYGLPDVTFRKLDVPQPSPLEADWAEFLKGGQQHPSYWYVVGYLQCPVSRGTSPFNLRKLRAELGKENGTIQAINLKYNTSFPSIAQFSVAPINFSNRFVDFPDTALLKKVEQFSAAQPTQWRCYLNLTNFYRDYLRQIHGRTIEAYNAAEKTNFASWNDVPFGSTLASNGAWAKNDFTDFVRNITNMAWLRLSPSAAAGYHDYLTAKYDGKISLLNSRYGTTYASFADVPMSETLPLTGAEKSDWKGYIDGWKNAETHQLMAAPIEAISVYGPDFAFRDFLKAKYQTLDGMNAALGTKYTTWDVIQMPQQQLQYKEFLTMQGSLRWMFTTRNYVDVWNYLVVNGRGLVNTIIFCALSILAALTVDPIAAYALSRFKPKSSYKVLLFLMMTMAFPAMVTQIPTFLLLRDLGMLNTFWALILPGLANGYHIFLLKGFFDSLPKELYESAEMDGASEATIFFNITMSLSKPILAVIALSAFTSAYAAFIFALLICQDPKMWTLMVWLYQLQSTSGPGIVFSSLIIAALPTFGIFIACQNVIMRGIVVPVEK